MPSSIFYFVLLLALSSPQILAGKSLETNAADLVTQTCSQTLYKDLCISSLEKFSEANSTDLQGQAKIALKAASLNGGEVYEHIGKLFNKTSDNKIQQCLTDCSENYQDAIDQIEDSLAALDSKGYNDVITWVTAAMTDAQSCEDGFKEQNGRKSSLTEENTKFSHLCSICLSIVKLLQKN